MADSSPSIPYGYCHCGCGNWTNIIPKNCNAKGDIKGEPRLYLRGHRNRKLGPNFSVGPDTGCWNWLKTTVRSGRSHVYGLFTHDGRQRYAHRYYYEKTRGPIEAGKVLHHVCKNTLCVNPDHLQPLTPAEHRAVEGIAKLSPDEVREIKRRLARGTHLSVLASVYRVHVDTIRNIEKGRTWRDIV